MRIMSGRGIFCESGDSYEGLMKKIRTDRFNSLVAVSRFF